MSSGAQSFGRLGQDYDQFVAAISGYLTTVGRLDPFDLLDIPIGCAIDQARDSLGGYIFASAVEAIIAKRKRLLATDKGAAPGMSSHSSSKPRIRKPAPD